MSGSMSNLGPESAALFRSPTSSSNSEANTEDGRLMEAACRAMSEWSSSSSSASSLWDGPDATSWIGPDDSFRCCK
uniref:Uncharacterized protein n=1 Tax=Takifugu rubripes TaxID=31033 RepID=A0A3B5KFH8_TAKRU